MKSIIATLIPLFLVGCICPLTQRSDRRLEISAKVASSQSAGTFIPERDIDIGTPEQIKAYHVGRHVDSSDPNTLYERHSVYRREQSGYWNLAAASGAGATRSYYLTADKAQQSKQQRAYYEAAQEQARIAKEKLVNAEQRVAVLEKENAGLREKTRPSRIYDPNQQHQ